MTIQGMLALFPGNGRHYIAFDEKIPKYLPG
jgi:hypothetical protein